MVAVRRGLLHPDTDWLVNGQAIGVFVHPLMQDGSRLDREDNYIVTGQADKRIPVDVRLAGSSQWQPGEGITRKLSDEFALELVLEGNGELRVNGKQFNLLPGDVFLLHPGERQCYRALPGGVFRKMYCCLWPQTCTRLFMQMGLHTISRIRPPEKDKPRIKALFDHILALAISIPDGYRVALSAMAYEILVILSCADRAVPGAPKVPARIARVMEFVRDNTAAKFTMQDLARMAGCTPVHLNRLFKKHTGMHTYEWIQNWRMRLAAHLLRTTPRFSYDIATAVGYNDPYHFSAVFKRVTGMSPLVYRKLARRAERRAVPPRGAPGKAGR